MVTTDSIIYTHNSVGLQKDGRQADKLRKISKLMRQCNKLIMDGMNLKTMTTKGLDQKNKNRLMRQSKCGEARTCLSQQSLKKYNTKYMEIYQRTPRNSAVCGSTNMWRKSSRFRGYNWGVLMYADVNAVFNTLFIFQMMQ